MFTSKFKAVCTVKHILEALDLNIKNEVRARNDTVLDDTNAVQKAKIEANIKNSIAINYSTLCFYKPQLLVKIEASKRNEWP